MNKKYYLILNNYGDTMPSLKEYNKKRNFSKTKEPIGKKKGSSKRLKFVVQHHIATKDHYDLRLEYKGVYVSFAIPKGPSFNPKDKRLAVKVEDHPISYGNFEGTIPDGEYGAGTVMLWDKGYYKINEIDINKYIKFTLYGKRLIGNWTLVKLKDNNWLLIKEKDEFVGKVDISEYNTSIKTNRTMGEIKLGLDDINITNGDKIIYPKYKITKKDIIEYYKLVSDRMMPFLYNRLISTVRSPNGINEEKFFMKHLNTNSKNIGKKKFKKNDYYYIKNVSGLIEEVQMNSYEFHIWGSKKNNIKSPDIMVFDLDPDTNLEIKEVRKCALELKKILDELDLNSYLKTSGGKGYHIFVPINVSSYKLLEKISKNIVNVLINKYPDKYTTNIRKDKRKNKILIDYYRNKLGATSVCPYSLRLKENASISFPISWDDINHIKPDTVTINNVKKHLIKDDPWKDFFK